VLRRLSALEYQLTLQDLFELPAPPSLEGVPPDADKDGFRTFAEIQTVSSQHLRAYLDKARELADGLLADSTRRSSVIGCQLTAPDCLRSFVTRFGRLAYRRSLETAEVDALVTRAESDALDTEDRYRLVLEAMLTSPSFLYRVEVGSASEGVSTLTATELASRLSFAVWGRGPSATLLDQAEQGALDTPEGLRTVAESMLADPKAEQFFGAFFRQWLGFETLRPPNVPPAGWDDALLGAMQEETDQVLKDFAWGGGTFLDVLTANYTRTSRALATYYGLPAPGADGRVEFPAGSPRANTGLLTHASLLSAKSDGDPISIRGNWVRETFFCQHMSVPPDLAETLGERLVGLTRVQIVEKRNTEMECKGCHSLIDPIGVGFAAFDATGRYDDSVDITQYGIAPALPGAPDPSTFSSIAELSAKLRSMPEVSECLASRAFLYVGGREPVAADACTLESATRAFTSSGNFAALLAGIIEAPEFRLRRAPAATP